MVSSEVQRTLVKSPPELWAEISDPAALARHLDAFGEIRITRVEPEQRVDWQADDASGSVLIKPSGWGTKVKLTVTRESGETGVDSAAGAGDAATGQEAIRGESEGGGGAALAARVGLTDRAAPQDDAQTPATGAGADEPTAADAVTALRVARAPHPPSSAVEPAPEPRAEPEPSERADLSMTAAAERAIPPQPQLAIPPQAEAEPRRSFFVRLFGWRSRPRTIEPALELDAAEAAASDPPPGVQANTDVAGNVAGENDNLAGEDAAAQDAAPEDAAPGGTNAAAEDAAPESSDAAAEDTAAEGTDAAPEDAEAAAEDGAADEVTAALTSVLDRLGAAHHRPFSRS